MEISVAERPFLGHDKGAEEMYRPLPNKVSKEQDALVQSLISYKEIPSILVCPPTPEPAKTVSVVAPLTTISGRVSPPVMEQDPLKATEISTNLEVRYGPNSFYKDIESGRYCFNCEKRHQNVCVHKVVVGLKRGTTFTAHVSNKRCHTLVDTAASHSCMSLAFYEQLSLPQLKDL